MLPLRLLFSFFYLERGFWARSLQQEINLSTRCLHIRLLITLCQFFAFHCAVEVTNASEFMVLLKVLFIIYCSCFCSAGKWRGCLHSDTGYLCCSLAVWYWVRFLQTYCPFNNLLQSVPSARQFTLFVILRLFQFVLGNYFFIVWLTTTYV